MTVGLVWKGLMAVAGSSVIYAGAYAAPLVDQNLRPFYRTPRDMP